MSISACCSLSVALTFARSRQKPGGTQHSGYWTFWLETPSPAESNLRGLPQIFLCADLWKDTATLRAAYHDSLGVTEAFIKNGMQHALRTLGCEAAGDASKWDYEVC